MHCYAKSFRQPTRPSSLVVPPPPKELHEQFSRSVGSLCGALPMFSSLQAEHKHPAKHQDKCAHHKDHDHTTEQCRSLHYLVKRLIRVGHRDNMSAQSQDKEKRFGVWPSKPPQLQHLPELQRVLYAASVRERISFIQHNLPGGITRRCLDSTLGISKFDVRRVLIDPANGTPTICPRKPRVDTIWIQWSHDNFPRRRHVTHPSWSNHPERAILGGRGVILFKAIMGCAWLHSMKVIPSTYHQMVSYLTKDGQIDIFGSQLAACQCYQVAFESELPSNSESRPEPSNMEE
ncbi:hypothetical protein AAG906_002730 [Vitis piasezkii]